jgi:hypothetical protein
MQLRRTTAAGGSPGSRFRGAFRVPLLARRTLVFGSIRSFAFGILETGPKTFFLLIAVRHFGAGDAAKTLVSLPQAFGLIAALLVVSYLARLPVRRSLVVAIAMGLAAAGFFAAAAASSLTWHILWLIPASATGAVTLPLYTAIIKANYPARLRGRLVAVELVLAMLGSALFHLVGGAILEGSGDRYGTLIAGYGIANLIAAGALLFVPSRRPRRTSRAAPTVSPLAALALLWRDRAFGLTVGAWFLFGFGSLLVAPLRILFLTEPRYGFDLPAVQVALIAGTVPDIMRLLFTPIWANLFDRFNFISVRVGLNMCSVLSIVLFFQLHSVPAAIAGAALMGAFNAGGMLAWSLWVTRFADRENTAAYMSVHTFATGMRMMLGATIGIQLASRAGAELVAWIAVGFVVLGTLAMLPLRRSEQRFAAHPR